MIRYRGVFHLETLGYGGEYCGEEIYTETKGLVLV